MSAPDDDASRLAQAGIRLGKTIAADRLRTVWQAQRTDGSAVTVQMLEPGLAGTPQAAKFAASARLHAELAIEGLLRVRALSDDGLLSIADPCKGTAADIPSRNWTIERRVAFFRAVCGVLAELHKRGVVHGCLRPACVLLDDGSGPQVADVRLVDVARTFAGDLDNAHGLGAYAAPEARTGGPLDARSDVFSAGRLLHFLLAGETPPSAIEPLPRLDALAAIAPPGLTRIVRRCVAPEPDARYPSMQDLLADVERYKTHAAFVGRPHPQVPDPPVAANPPAAKVRPRASKKEHAKDVASAAGARSADRHVAAARGAPSSGSSHVPSSRPPSGDALPPSKLRAIVAGAGLAVAALAIAMAWVTASDAFALRALVGAGVAAATLIVPTLPGLRPLSHALAATLGFVLVFTLDPVGRASAGGRRAGLTSGDVAARAQAIQRMIAKGERHFEDMNLASADFSEGMLMNAFFNGADLTGVSFRKAILTGSCLRGAKLVGTSFDAARLEEADLAETDLSRAVDLPKATCDAQTRFPPGWRCEQYRPAHAEGIPGSAASASPR